MYLQALGIEEETFAGRIIHVAGTNGKGSVCNYLTNLLLAEGFHVGTFISPHLVHMRERIRLDNRRLCQRLRVLNNRASPVRRLMRDLSCYFSID